MASYLEEEDKEMRAQGFERVWIDGAWGYLPIPWYRRVLERIRDRIVTCFHHNN